MRCFRKFAKILPVSGRFLFVFSALVWFASVAFGAGDYQRTKDGKTTVWNAEPKPGDEATWFGDRDGEGYATGAGTLTWYTAKGNVYGRYFGNMVRGKFSGPVNVHSKGKTGHATFADGKRTSSWASGPAPLVRRGEPIAVVLRADETRGRSWKGIRRGLSQTASSLIRPSLERRMLP